MERKLTAIFSADVKGYSRLMGEDEAATISTLTVYREVITTLIQQHRGRVVDSPGDNLLAEFASAVDAVQSAVAIQRELKAGNAELPDSRKMEYRIGINVGDVVVEGERLYGDGVNIAARLESLAIPGGICISGTAYDHVENKLPFTYEYRGEQTVKNIAKPVRVYRVVEESASQKAKGKKQKPALSVVEGAKIEEPKPRRLRPVYRWMAAGLVLIGATLGTVWYFSRPPLSPQDSALRIDAAPAALPLPDKPSLIVLPFVNMSKDPDQDYFSDGLTEVLTGDLSKISSLFVIARNSAFMYKGKAVKVQDVGREMGVRYVLEGSVQKADQRIRITTQLIDAITGYHLWSEQYDRPLTDIFALQDEIVQKIVTTLRLQLTLWEQGILVRKTTNNLEAYDAFLRGLESFHRFTPETTAQARQLWEKTIALDPQYAEAYALLGWTYCVEWNWRWSADPQTLERALALAQQALALNDSPPGAHSPLSNVYALKKQTDRAVAAGERAIALDPNDAGSYTAQAEALLWAGRPEDTLRAVAQAMRLNPRYSPWLLVLTGDAYHMTGHYTEAIATLKEALRRSPTWLTAYLDLAVSYWLQWLSQQSPTGQTLEPALAAVQQAQTLNDSHYAIHIILGYLSLSQQHYGQALEEMERAVALAPTEAESQAALAVALSCMGRSEESLSELGQAAEAQKEAAEVLRLNPNFSLAVHKQRMPIKDPAVLERHIAALRKAGLK